MKIINVSQNSLAWLSVRSGVVTASEFGSLFTNKMNIKKLDSDGPQTYLHRKLAELWRGGPLPGFNTLDMEFGKLKEEQAIPFFEMKYDMEVKRVGFVMSDDDLTGCSPDGMLADSGLEVKCLQDQNHLKYLLAGQLPEEFAPQVHGSMYATGLKSWHFFAYCVGFPPLLVVVQRDETIMEMMQEHLTDFSAHLATAHQRLVELNGGVEPKPNPFRVAALSGQLADEPAVGNSDNFDTPP